jgi:hypothetical protein
MSPCAQRVLGRGAVQVQVSPDGGSDVRVVHEKTLDGELVPPGALHSFLDGRAGDTDTGHVVAGDAVLDTGRGAVNLADRTGGR